MTPSEQTDSPRPGFSDFTLPELVLIQQGLWRIGEENAVDHRLVPEWRGLLARLRSAVQAKIAEAPFPTQRDIERGEQLAREKGWE